MDFRLDPEHSQDQNTPRGVSEKAAPPGPGAAHGHSTHPPAQNSSTFPYVQGSIDGVNSQPEASMASYPPPRPPPSQLKKKRTSMSRKLFGNPRSLRHCCHMVWLDVLFILMVLAVTLVVVLRVPIYKQGDRVFRVWPTQNASTGEWGWRGDPDLSYPIYEENKTNVSTTKLLGNSDIAKDVPGFIVEIVPLSVALPIVCGLVLVVMQLFVRDCQDKVASLIGLYKSFALITFLHVTLKAFVGRFRPNFMTHCGVVLKPLILVEGLPVPSDLSWARVSECQAWKGNDGHPTKQLKQAMEGWPSGHTAECFCAASYLALYLNGKLKPFSDYHGSLWKLIVVFAPLYGAMFVASSLTIDHNHSLIEIILSIPLGVIVALMSYRSQYASLFNYRINHLHLPWSSLHRSLDQMPQAPIDNLVSNYRNSRFRWHDNLAAVAWPRKPMHHEFDVGQEKKVGPSRNVAEYDGPAEYESPPRHSLTPAEAPAFMKKAGAMFRKTGKGHATDVEDVEAGAGTEPAFEHSEVFG